MEFNIFKQAHKHQTDEQLMSLVFARGSEQAFEELYNRYYKKLLWFSMRLVGSKEQAEDIVQDTFIKIIDKPAAFNPTLRFSTWIYTIVNNACLTNMRNETHRDKLLAENYVPVHITHLKHNIDVKFIQQKINTLYKDLSSKEQVVFVLRFEQELSIKEIAAIAQIPEGSVKSCLFYLLKKMAQQLKNYQITNN
ncbi:MAG: RNA polymerase sigma factor [Bacteroidota bacterium]